MVIKEARNVELLSWDELTPEQQDYVINNWEDISKISNTMYDWFNEDTSMFYEENRDEIAQKYEKEYGLEINAEQLYWQSNSQGPYPEWKLNKVFSDISGEDDYIDYDIKFGDVGGLDVEGGVSIDIYIDDPEEDERIFDGEYYLDELEQSPNVPLESFDKINNIIQGAQEFIDEFWNYVNEICTAYPDDDWVRDTLDANPDIFDFYIDDDGEVNVW